MADRAGAEESDPRCNCTQNRTDLNGHHQKCRLYVAPQPVEWIETAFLPREGYRVIEKPEGWSILTVDDHGAFS